MFNFNGPNSINHSVIGNNNHVINNFGGASASQSEKLFTNEDYFQLLLAVWDQERIGLGNYLEDIYTRHGKRNEFFIHILYKDVLKVLEGIGPVDEVDLLIINGDLEIGYNDIKLTGNPSNFHHTLIWLHTKLIEKFTQEGPTECVAKFRQFQKEFLNDETRTPAYIDRLLALGRECRQSNRNNPPADKSFWRTFNSVISAKPSLFGVTLDVNEVVNKLFLEPKSK